MNTEELIKRLNTAVDSVDNTDLKSLLSAAADSLTAFKHAAKIDEDIIETLYSRIESLERMMSWSVES